MFTDEQQVNEIFSAILESNSGSHTPIAKDRVHKRNSEKVVIGQIDRLDHEVTRSLSTDNEFSQLFYCTAFPDLGCEICFDHPLDHYPLMMIFEMGRQMGIAISHEFYDVPLTGYTNIVDSLSFEFKQFLELDKPVYIICADSDIHDRKGIHRRKMTLAFIQEGIHCASGSGNVSVLRHSLYLRMRASSRSKILKQPVTNARAIPTNVEINNPQRIAAI